MAINQAILGPKNSDEKEEFAIEALVFSVQVALQRAMNKHGVTNKELAERLGMSPARVSQIFSNKGPNLTLKTIARIQHALGEDFELVSKSDPMPTKQKVEFRPFTVISFSSSNAVWSEVPANGERTRVRAKAA